MGEMTREPRRGIEHYGDETLDETRLAEPTLAKGIKLGDFEIEALLGAGGMGEVYRARDLRLGRMSPLKCCGRYLIAGQDWLRRFEREA